MGDLSKLNSKRSNFCYVWAQFGPLNPITSPQTLLAADQRLYTIFSPSANDFHRKPYSKSLKIRTLGLVSSFTVKTQPFQNLFAKKGMGSIVFFDQHSQQTKRPERRDLPKFREKEFLLSEGSWLTHLLRIVSWNLKDLCV